jgi:hypothetical protein
VCAEHKKPAKLLKHLAAVKEASEGLRNPPRVLVFANRIKVFTVAVLLTCLHMDSFAWEAPYSQGNSCSSSHAAVLTRTAT